jgi:hypothetical protein
VPEAHFEYPEVKAITADLYHHRKRHGHPDECAAGAGLNRTHCRD